MEQERLNSLIKELISQPRETEIIEFKVNNSSELEIGKKLSALANSANLNDAKFAYLVFGVEDIDHKVVGTTFDPENKKVGEEQMIFWINKMLKPDLNFRIFQTMYEGERIVVFQIPPAVDQPVKFQKIAYVRVGSATPKLVDYPNKEAKIWNNINRNSFEKGLASEGLKAHEVLELLDYSEYFRLTKQDVPSNTEMFLERMAQDGLVKKVFSDTYDVTNLGAILFAKDLKQFPSIKRKSIRVIFYKGSGREERVREKEEFGGYATAFEQLLDYINDKLPHNEEISRSLRKEVKMYPEVALREFLANTLIHQDLSITGTGPLVEIFDNRIEITNPGVPLIETIRFIDHPPRSRNEDLASFMRRIGVCEESGTGIDRALTYIALYQLPAPLFESFEGFTRVTMFAHQPLRKMSLEDKVRACFQHCVLKHVQKQRMSNASLRERLGIPESNYPAASKIISETKKRGLIKKFPSKQEYVPYWA